MERHRVKRLLVVRGDKLVGIVTRANLLHALASVAAEAKPGHTDDASIREKLYAELKTQPWAPVNLIDIHRPQRNCVPLGYSAQMSGSVAQSLRRQKIYLV